MALNIEYFPAAGIAANPGFFIPVPNLPGLTGDELDPTSVGRESKFILSYLNQIYDAIQNRSRPLGLNVTKASPVGAGTNLINQNFSLTMVYAINHLTNVIDEIPIPTSGGFINAGALKFDIAFPAARGLAAGDPTGGAGVLIPVGEILTNGGKLSFPSPAPDANADSRSALAAIMRMIVRNATLKSSAVDSAIIAASKSSTTLFTPPASFTAQPDPLTSIPASDLVNYSFVNLAYSLTMQLKIDDVAQTFDVNVSPAVGS